jgi:hypothetical protein
MNRSIPATIALFLSLLVSACGNDGPTGPVSGVITVSLSTATADDRAIMVSVAGPEEITGIEAANPSYTVHSRGSGTAFRAAVFGNLGAGALLRFTVPDVNKVSSYTATVLQVSDAANAVRAESAGYTLTLAR